MTKQVHIYVTEELKARLENLSEKKQIKISVLLGTFLDLNEQHDLLDPKWIMNLIKKNKSDPVLKENPKEYFPDLPDQPREGFGSWIKPFNTECEFGSWDDKKNLIYCKCGYPSIIKGNPKNKLVPREACEKCYPRIKSIQVWIEEKNKEREDNQKRWFESHGYKVTRRGFNNPE